MRGVARELARLTGRWVLCYDIEHSPNEDLDSDEVKAFIEKLVASGCFLGVGGGPVCGSFSTAVTPPVRSREYPMGRPGVSESMQRKIDQGNRFAAWMVLILGLALSMKMGVWLENPASSWLFRLPLWKQFMEEHTELGVWLVDYCRFYMRWRKRTAIVSNSELRGHRHQSLMVCAPPVFLRSPRARKVSPSPQNCSAPSAWEAFLCSYSGLFDA